MNIEQVGLQLGLAGLIIVAVYRVAMFFVLKWAEGEKARTQVMQETFQKAAENEAARTRMIDANFAILLQRLDDHATADTRSHGEMGGRISRFEGKLDEILNWQDRTPVGAEPITPPEIRHETRPYRVPAAHYSRRRSEDPNK